MNLSFGALEPQISEQITMAKVVKVAAASKIATSLLANKSRFLEVQSFTGVPALWIMPVFYRENPDFNSYLGNGDPINKPTTHVPAGRGPFTSWEAGAVDALELDHITQVDGWDWPRAAYQWESWNGFGPRMHGRPSGYVWAGTDQYAGGKFVHDGPGGWSPGTWDQQIGCVAIARELATQDSSLTAGFAAAVVAQT
jgi:lysozyme family protein